MSKFDEMRASGNMMPTAALAIEPADGQYTI